jgi:hypothetical protein
MNTAKVQRVRKWGERSGNCCTFLKEHVEDGGKFLALAALMLIAVCLLIPLAFEVEHLVKMGEKMADDVEGAVLDSAENIIQKVADAVANPRAAFMAYNRVTGTMIICDDGTEYSWHPMVMKNGVVTNPYSGCVLHQTKLNGEEKARFFPGEAPQAGDNIEEEHTIEIPESVEGSSSGDSGSSEPQHGPRGALPNPRGFNSRMG